MVGSLTAGNRYEASIERHVQLIKASMKSIVFALSFHSMILKKSSSE